MGSIFETIGSTGFQGAFHNFGIVAIVFALGTVAASFAYYGRGREVLPEDPTEARWVLLFATWRDSLILTLLYVAEGFAFDLSNFQGISTIMPATILLYAPIVQPLFSFTIHVLLFTIASLRIIAITRWLADTRA